MTLPIAAFRDSAITLMGSGMGGIPVDSLVQSLGELMQATVPASLEIATRTFRLCEVESVCARACSMRELFLR
jgi:hypothetical protein